MGKTSVLSQLRCFIHIKNIYRGFNNAGLYNNANQSLMRASVVPFFAKNTVPLYYRKKYFYLLLLYKSPTPIKTE